MAKSSFFKDGGSGSNVSATIQSQVDAAAAHAQAAANSFNSIGNELTLAQAARAGSETARDASVVAQNASESARDTAIQQASNAAGSASSASASEGTAQAAETAAVASQNAAATSEGNAATSEQNAATSATASQTAQAASESARDASVVARTASETAKTASEAAQTASETARDASVVARTASETAKTASEAARDLALSYRNTAETHKNDATTQAGIATTQAGTATTQAGNAQTSATSAATAQAAAESARDSALAAFDSFDDRYLGAKTTTGGDPTQDNDGNSLVAGALFFDSTNSVMKLYTGSAWVAAYVSGGSFASLSGATFTGDVTVPNLITSGNVDGRDVSVDGAKLDGIAANATAVTSLTDLNITDGTNGQALKTDGNGNFSFGDVTSSVAFADLTGKPTTLSGYGITDSVAQLSDTSSPNYQTPSSRRVDPNGDNPTNAHYAITTFGNGGNVTGQIAAHFQTGQLYSRGYNSSFSTWRKIWNDQNDGSGSGLDADLLDGIQGSAFLRSDTADTASGKITMTTGIARNNHNTGYLEGSYNNVGNNGNATNPIYVIGSSYVPSTTSLSNMYGIGYSRGDSSFIPQTSSSHWGMYVAADGDARIFLNGTNGQGLFSGNVTAYAS